MALKMSNISHLENTYKMIGAIMIQNMFIELEILKVDIVPYCRPSIFNNVFIHK